MKVLKEGEEEAAQTAAIWGGFKGGLVATAGVLVAGLIAQRRSALFRGVSIPGKTFIASSLVVAGTVIGGERALKNFEHHKYHAPAADAVTVAEPEAARPFVHYLATHRYHLIAGVWGTAMVGALAISFSQPHLKLSQKIIHARMYAQFGAVAALLATAALSQLDEPKAVTLPDGKVILPSALPAQHKY